MKLAFSPASPYVRKVRVCALELGLHDAIELAPITTLPTNPNQDYARTTNPLGKIPALTLDDGTVLYDSSVICEYLDSLKPEAGLIPADQRWDILTQHHLATGITDALLLMRYEYAVRPEALRWQDWYTGQEGKVNQGLDWFESHFEILNKPLNLAHIALGCTLGYLGFRFPDLDWQNHRPQLASWYQTFSQRPSMTETTPE